HDHQDHDHRDHLRDEGQGRFVDLRDRLENTDEQTDRHSGGEQRTGEQDRGLEGLRTDRDHHVFGHPKLLTRLPTTSSQPSTRTKSRSLNGSEITTGGSIIMPMAMRTLATTMSSTRNGR